MPFQSVMRIKDRKLEPNFDKRPDKVLSALLSNAGRNAIRRKTALFRQKEIVECIYGKHLILGRFIAFELSSILLKLRTNAIQITRAAFEFENFVSTISCL